jgi:hypothetical protein
MMINSGDTCKRYAFREFYVLESEEGKTVLLDVHSLTRRWPLALLTIAGTLLLAIIAVHFVGG